MRAVLTVLRATSACRVSVPPTLVSSQCIIIPTGPCTTHCAQTNCRVITAYPFPFGNVSVSQRALLRLLCLWNCEFTLIRNLRNLGKLPIFAPLTFLIGALGFTRRCLCSSTSSGFLSSNFFKELLSIRSRFHCFRFSFFLDTKVRILFENAK